MWGGWFLPLYVCSLLVQLALCGSPSIDVIWGYPVLCVPHLIPSVSRNGSHAPGAAVQDKHLESGWMYDSFSAYLILSLHVIIVFFNYITKIGGNESAWDCDPVMTIMCPNPLMLHPHFYLISSQYAICVALYICLFIIKTDCRTLASWLMLDINLLYLVIADWVV